MRALLVSLVLLAACAPQASPPSGNEPAPPPPSASGPQNAEEATAQDTCGAARFRNLVGTQADQIDRSTLPPSTRIIMPGQMVTMDFSAQRLNIRVGPDGKVTTLECF